MDAEQIPRDIADIGRRVVCHSYVGPLFVSTVKMPWVFDPDHRYETMIFGLADDDNYERQWATIKQAEAGHAEAVSFAFEWCRGRGWYAAVESFSGELAARELVRRRSLPPTPPPSPNASTEPAGRRAASRFLNP